MALIGAYENKKTRRLARSLQMPAWAAMGLMEAFWHWARKSARTGRIEADQWEDLAEYLQWQTSPGKLRSLLLGAELIDSKDGWDFIHDWDQHADDALRKALERHQESFANGSEPRRWRSAGSSPEVPRKAEKVHREFTESSPEVPRAKTPKTAEVHRNAEKVPRNGVFGEPSRGRACPEPEPEPEPEIETTPAAARGRDANLPSDPQPELHAAVNRIAAFWPNPGRIPDAITAAISEFGHGPPGQNVARWTTAAESNAMLWADYHRRGKAASGKNHFIPTLKLFFRDGDYSRQPPEPIETKPTKKRLSDSYQEFK